VLEIKSIYSMADIIEIIKPDKNHNTDDGLIKHEDEKINIYLFAFFFS
jgi:hypothetical protein